MESTLLKNGFIIPVDSPIGYVKEGSILIEGDRIKEIGETRYLKRKYSPDEVFNAKGKAMLPGFVNTHMHSGFIRGLAEDLPVWEWLKKHVDPTHQALKSEEARAAYRLCYAEAVKAGITCSLDMYRFMHEAAKIAEKLGVRVTLAPYVADKPEYDYFESLKDNLKLVRERHMSADGKIRVWFGLEHLEYCTEEAFLKTAEYAKKHDVGIHTHGEESREEAEKLTKQHGKRPIEIFSDRDILGPKTCLAHCVWLEPKEIELLSRTGTSVAHCPTSNEKLASGVAPIMELRKNGVNVGLGSDGIKENNRIDIIQEMKIASLLQKVHNLDATLIPAYESLKMATIEGARALGLDEEIGSLEPGKKADVIMIDLKKLHLTPLISNLKSNIIPNIVHAAQASDVDSVIIDGKFIVKNRELLTDDEKNIIEEHTEATIKLLERREKYIPRD